MLTREANMNDAEPLIQLIKQVEVQSNFMLFEAGERKTTAEQLKSQIENIEKLSNSVIFVAEEEHTLIGYLMAIGGQAKKTKHSAYLVIGIEDSYKNKGIGTALFQTLEDWAINQSIVRLELTVVTNNEAAIALYSKCGFEIEGIKRKSLFMNDYYFDEYYMSKLLGV